MPKPPQYSLLAYLEDIRARKEQTLRKLGQAEEAIRREEATKEALVGEQRSLQDQHVHRKKDYWKRMATGALTGMEITGLRRYLDTLQTRIRDKRMEVLAQDRVVRKAREEAEAVRQELKRISGEVEAHEKLEEQELEAWKEAEERKAQKELDEIASNLYERRRRERK